MSCSLHRLLVVALCCAVASLAFAVDYAAYSNRLSSVKTAEEKSAILKELAAELPEDSPIYGDIERAASGDAGQAALDHAVGLVRARAYLESPTSLPDKDAKAMARDISSSPAFRDPGAQEESNWVGRAFERLFNKFKPKFPARKSPRIDVPAGNPGALLWIVWALLGLGAATFLFFALRSFAWKRSLKRKAMALLDEDEPERSADEWLEAADKLIAEGRLREAVRCLYLACLLRLDEHGVARFDRGQTNWEHYHRIEASPLRPQNLDFRTPTQDFDRIWYGMRNNGMADVDAFKSFYNGLMAALHQKAA